MKRLSWILVVLWLVVGCGNQNQFVQINSSQVFVQNLNPEYVDVLWMIDDRSPMYYTRDHLVSEATRFFTRLDSATTQYQMSFVSADMEINPGRLKPVENPARLVKNVGSVQERANVFGGILSNVMNLHTGATDRGFQSVITALSNYFHPRATAPLVLVFISDSDDHSPVPTTSTSAVDYYEQALLSFKGGNRDLIRVYSVNYLPLNGAAKTSQNRCATFSNADIDKAGFEDRYFQLAQRFSGTATSAVTADLCGSFADQINLNGLRLTELPRRFKLDTSAEPDSITVLVILNGQKLDLPYTYDAATNEVVFDTAPPEGAQIQVNFRSK